MTQHYGFYIKLIIIGTCIMAVAWYQLSSSLASLVSLQRQSSSSPSLRQSSSFTTSPPPPDLPSPITIACLGLPRSGSTITFNLVRLLMERLDPNTISGYIYDKIISNPSEDPSKLEFQQLSHALPRLHKKLPVIYKSHDLDEDMYNATDFFIIPYRDPLEAACSMAMMFNHESLDQPEKAKEGHQYMQSLIKTYKKFLSNNNKNVIHIHYSALLSDEGKVEIIQHLLDMFGIQGQIDIQAIIHDLQRLQSPQDGLVLHHPRSLYHSQHVTDPNNKGRCKKLIAYLESDEEFKSLREEQARMLKEARAHQKIDERIS